MAQYLAHIFIFLAAVFVFEALLRFFQIYRSRNTGQNNQGPRQIMAGMFLVGAVMFLSTGLNLQSGREVLEEKLVPKDEYNAQRKISALAFHATGRTELKEVHDVVEQGKGLSQRYWLQHFYNGGVIDMGLNFYVPHSGRMPKLRDNETFLNKVKGRELFAPQRSDDGVYTIYKRKDEYDNAQRCFLFERVLSTRLDRSAYNGYVIGDFCYPYDRVDLDKIATDLMKSAQIRHKLPSAK